MQCQSMGSLAEGRRAVSRQWDTVCQGQVRHGLHIPHAPGVWTPRCFYPVHSWHSGYIGESIKMKPTTLIHTELSTNEQMNMTSIYGILYLTHTDCLKIPFAAWSWCWVQVEEY